MVRARLLPVLLAVALVSGWQSQTVHAELIGRSPTDGLCAKLQAECQASAACRTVLACYTPCKLLPPMSQVAARCGLRCHQLGLKLSQYVAYQACVSM